MARSEVDWMDRDRYIWRANGIGSVSRNLVEGHFENFPVNISRENRKAYATLAVIVGVYSNTHYRSVPPASPVSDADFVDNIVKTFEKIKCISSQRLFQANQHGEHHGRQAN